ncbi:MAG: HEAT repeat domain-containing protein [Methanomassiliicoccales archaeon]|nr:MAG: HEAT repeat domain-containing protein [Methanomassiliicoccales archaeon]
MNDDKKGKEGEAKENPEEDLVGDFIEEIQSADDWQVVYAVINEVKLEPASLQEQIVAGVLPLTEDKDSEVRSNVARALGRLGEGLPETQRETIVIRLLELSKDKEQTAQAAAALALGDLGKAIPESRCEDVADRLLEFTRDKNEKIRASAAWALGYLGKAEALPGSRLGDIVDSLIDLACEGKGEAGIRKAVAQALGDIRGEIPKAAILALGDFGGILSEARLNDVVDLLIKLSEEKRGEIRASSTWALGELAKALTEARRKEVIDCLLKLTHDKDRTVRRTAAQALGDFKQDLHESHHNAVVDRLIDLMHDQDEDVYEIPEESLSLLWEAFPESLQLDIVNRLLDHLSDENWQVRRIAKSALYPLFKKTPEQHHEGVVDRYLELSRNEEGQVRTQAILALTFLGTTLESRQKDVVERLKELRDDEDKDVCEAAAGALDSFEESREEAYEMDTKALRTELLAQLRAEVDEELNDGFSSAELDYPYGEISAVRIGSWLWVKSRLVYEGATWNPSTDRASGDPISVHGWRDWIGLVESAPAKVSTPDELDSWALFSATYKRTYKDVQVPAPWGSHKGRWVEKLTEDGGVKVLEASGFFRDVEPESTATVERVRLSE